MNLPQHLILAQETAPAGAPAGEGPPPGPGGLGQMLPMMLLMFVIFYFVLIRPQRKQQKELEKKREGIQIGDDVVTIGGVHGRVTNKSDRTVTVKVSDNNTKIKFEKTAINQVFANNKEQPDDATVEADAEVVEEKDKS